MKRADEQTQRAMSLATYQEFAYEDWLKSIYEDQLSSKLPTFATQSHRREYIYTDLLRFIPSFVISTSQQQISHLAASIADAPLLVNQGYKQNINANSSSKLVSSDISLFRWTLLSVVIPLRASYGMS